MCDTCESRALIGVIVITIQVRISKACQIWCQRLEPESLSGLQRLPKTKKENLHPPPQTQLAVVARFQRQRSSSVNTRHCTKKWRIIRVRNIWDTIKGIQFSAFQMGINCFGPFSFEICLLVNLRELFSKWKPNTFSKSSLISKTTTVLKFKLAKGRN
jgi:hypothetical protein